MVEYFPGWNLSVVATLNNGGYVDEVDRACRPVRELARQGSDAGTAALFASWSAVADRLLAIRDKRDPDGLFAGCLTAAAAPLNSNSWEA